jgi:hypothetical protein
LHPELQSSLGSNQYSIFYHISICSSLKFEIGVSRIPLILSSSELLLSWCFT